MESTETDYSGYKECGHPEYRKTSDGPQPNDCGCVGDNYAEASAAHAAINTTDLADPFKNIPNADDSENGEFSPARPIRTEDAERAGYIAGLRELAEILETMPGIPLPYHGSGAKLAIYFFSSHEDNRARMAAAARAIGGQWAKDGDDTYFDMTTTLAGGLQLQMSAFREQVCRKVVTGRREITELVPDPSAPKIKVTRTVEDVTWECSPLLAEHAQAAPSLADALKSSLAAHTQAACDTITKAAQ